MGNTTGSHLLQTPSTSPRAVTPPRLPSPFSPPLGTGALETHSFDAATPALNGSHFPSCSSQRDSRSPVEDVGRRSVCVEGEMEAVQEMGFTLIRLLEQHRASLGLSSASTGAAGLLKVLLAEREEMLAEIQSLKETLKSEREEWGQFESDLRVAVSVADRLRLEAEESVKNLRDTNTHTLLHLDETMTKQSQTERELERVRAELSETQQTLHTLTLQHQHTLTKLNTLTSQHQHTLTELGTLRNVHQHTLSELNTLTQAHQNTHSELNTLTLQHQHTLTELNTLKQRSRVPTRDDQQCQNIEDKIKNQNTTTERRDEISRKLELNDAEEMNECVLKKKDPQTPGEESEKSDKCPLGKQEREDRKRKDCSPVRGTQRIIMLSERSRSLSQIPLPGHSSPILYGSSQNLTSTTSTIKNGEAVKSRRPESLLQRQDNWSRRPQGKQEVDAGCGSLSASSSKIRCQDGFSLLLRRHGGSRRNSLLRWSQSRTQGYENVEITNFSSSWEDGLAFCAIYHSYLPSHIPYSSLKADDKTVEEMLREEGPDWQKVLGYVENMYRHFEM